MAPRIRIEEIKMDVLVPLEVDQGVILPAGTYKGETEQTETSALSGISWSDPNFYLSLDTIELGRMGIPGGPGLMGRRYLVTEHVHNGNIMVRF
jgi:hypothetical protein